MYTTTKLPQIPSTTHKNFLEIKEESEGYDSITFEDYKMTENYPSTIIKDEPVDYYEIVELTNVTDIHPTVRIYDSKLNESQNLDNNLEDFKQNCRTLELFDVDEKNFTKLKFEDFKSNDSTSNKFKQIELPSGHLDHPKIKNNFTKDFKSEPEEDFNRNFQQFSIKDLKFFLIHDHSYYRTSNIRQLNNFDSEDEAESSQDEDEEEAKLKLRKLNKLSLSVNFEVKSEDENMKRTQNKSDLESESLKRTKLMKKSTKIIKKSSKSPDESRKSSASSSEGSEFLSQSASISSQSNSESDESMDEDEDGIQYKEISTEELNHFSAKSRNLSENSEDDHSCYTKNSIQDHESHRMEVEKNKQDFYIKSLRNAQEIRNKRMSEIVSRKICDIRINKGTNSSRNGLRSSSTATINSTEIFQKSATKTSQLRSYLMKPPQKSQNSPNSAQNLLNSPQNYQNLSQTSPNSQQHLKNLTKSSRMSLNSPERIKMSSNSPERIKMSSNSPGSSIMSPKSPTCVKISSGYPEGTQMSSDLPSSTKISSKLQKTNHILPNPLQVTQMVLKSRRQTQLLSKPADDTKLTSNSSQSILNPSNLGHKSSRKSQKSSKISSTLTTLDTVDLLTDSSDSDSKTSKTSQKIKKSSKLQQDSPQKFEPTTPFKCPDCPMIFQDTLRLNRHKRLHQAPQFQCRNCLRKFKRKSMLKKHFCDIKCPTCSDVCTCRMENANDCIICQKINFRYFTDYKQHMVSHHNEIVYCKICEKNNFTLFKHKQLGHELVRSFKCTECTSILKSREQLKYHMEIHAKNFNCVKCGKIFTRRYLLRQHELTHEDPNRFHCEICDKNFQRKFCLDNHRKTIHGDKMKEFYYLKQRREMFGAKSVGWISCSKCPALFKNRKSHQRHVGQAH